MTSPGQTLRSVLSAMLGILGWAGVCCARTGLARLGWAELLGRCMLHVCSVAYNTIM